jgi:hypothetical protein
MDSWRSNADSALCFQEAFENAFGSKLDSSKKE